MRLFHAFVFASCCACGSAAVSPDAAIDGGAAISGTVEHMWDGFSVVLRLDAGATSEMLTVDHDGPFAFTTAVATGTTFAVTVATPPPGHTCTVDTVPGSVHVDCRVVTGISSTVPAVLPFDPDVQEYDVPVSALTTSAAVSVIAPLADRITVEATPVASGASSPVFHIPHGGRTLTIAVTVADATHLTFVRIDRDTRPIQQLAYIKAPTNNPGALFGSALVMDNDALVVGAPGEASSAGAVYVYRRTGITWALEARLVAGTAAAGDRFGAALCLHDDVLFVGAPGEAGESGRVHTFARSGTTWIEGAPLQASIAEPGDHFGSSLSAEGSDLLVGAPDEDSNAIGVGGDSSSNTAVDSGAAYLFSNVAGGSWTQEAYAKATNTDAGDHFGASVNLHLGSAWIGAPDEDAFAGETDNTGTDSGAVYTYDVVDHAMSVPSNHYRKLMASKMAHAGASMASCPEGLYRLVGGSFFMAYMIDTITRVARPVPTTDIITEYGAAIGCDDSYAVVGAPMDDGSGTGVDPASAPNAPGSGAAYLVDFTLADQIEPNDPQTTYVKASNTEAGDHFGAAVGIADGVAAVGAPHESSSASGIGGEQTNNESVDSGAVYVFH